MSKIIYLDSTGGKLIAQLRKEYNDAGITLILASVSGKKNRAYCLHLFETFGITYQPVYLFHEGNLGHITVCTFALQKVYWIA